MGIIQDWKIGWVFVLFSGLMFFLGINFLLLDLESPATAPYQGSSFWLNYLENGIILLIGFFSLLYLAPKWAEEKRKDQGSSTKNEGRHSK